MSNKKYYWLKLEKDFFKRHDIKIIESMDNGKDYIIFYMKLLLESMNHNGRLRYNESIPYDPKTLSIITDTNVDIVKAAIDIFTSLHLLEVLDDRTYYLNEVSKMVGNETEWARKKREYREQKQLETTQGHEKTKSDKSIELEIELDIEIDKDIKDTVEVEKLPYQEIITHLNNRTNKSYRVTDSVRSNIRARFNEGHTLTDFETVIDKKCVEWSNTEMSKYLRPQTLFGTKFDNYLNQDVIKPKNSNSYLEMQFDSEGNLI